MQCKECIDWYKKHHYCYKRVVDIYIDSRTIWWMRQYQISWRLPWGNCKQMEDGEKFWCDPFIARLNYSWTTNTISIPIQEFQTLQHGKYQFILPFPKFFIPWLNHPFYIILFQQALARECKHYYPSHNQDSQSWQDWKSHFFHSLYYTTPFLWL